MNQKLLIISKPFSAILRRNHHLELSNIWFLYQNCWKYERYLLEKSLMCLTQMRPNAILWKRAPVKGVTTKIQLPLIASAHKRYIMLRFSFCLVVSLLGLSGWLLALIHGLKLFYIVHCTVLSLKRFLKTSCYPSP